MNRLKEIIHNIYSSGRVNWTVNADFVIVVLGKTQRKQRVCFACRGDEYIFRSGVLGNTLVTRKNADWNKCARMAWERNGGHEFVAFGFDNENRLQGVIRIHSAIADEQSIEYFINTLARECDRFEYVLTGADRL